MLASGVVHILSAVDLVGFQRLAIDQNRFRELGDGFFGNSFFGNGFLGYGFFRNGFFRNTL